jgi:hypothetical protein
MSHHAQPALVTLVGSWLTIAGDSLRNCVECTLDCTSEEPEALFPLTFSSSAKTKVTTKALRWKS